MEGFDSYFDTTDESVEIEEIEMQKMAGRDECPLEETDTLWWSWKCLTCEIKYCPHNNYS